MNNVQNRKIEAAQGEGEHRAAAPSTILRFHRSERLLHWSLAIPFVVCVATAAILMVFYNLHPRWAFRSVFAWAHRLSGACLILFPLIIAILHWRDHPLHWRNIREAWTWTVDDVKWLLLMGAAVMTGKDNLPEQGKFNAAEKLNFMTLMCGYPIFVVTGLILWSSKIAFLSWLIHIGMAALAAPLVLGHMYMAIINRSTRAGLDGMFSGYVDRKWAKHHYARWYRRHFEKDACYCAAPTAEQETRTPSRRGGPWLRSSVSREERAPEDTARTPNGQRLNPSFR